MKRMFGLLMLLGACGGPDYDPVRFAVEGDQIVAVGAIGPEAIAAFQEVTAANPDIDTLVLKSIEGSVDDDANLELARLVREAGFTTVVPAGGMVASGGTDLFLAGQRRVLETGACVGVHSWTDGETDGADLPRSASDHQLYLSYYQIMGIPQAFYWFTLEQAPAAGMHWMTGAEAARFDMTTRPAPDLSVGPSCEER